MNTRSINQTFDLLALAERDTKLKHSGRYWFGPCPFCGGRDRFQIKRTDSGYLWICRKCGTGKYQDAIAYVTRRESLDIRKDFAEVIRRMGFTPDALTPIQPTRSESRPLITLPPDDWMRSALTEIDTASDNLIESAAWLEARRYLASRGLRRGTCNAWDIGAARVFNRPAIVIPYIERAGAIEKVTGIRYRFIDAQAQEDKSKRFISRPGSVFYLYGLCNRNEENDSLILCEGEFNTLSLWQVSITGADVISFGSQSITETQITLARTLAGHYRRVILWMDEEDKVKQTARELDRNVDMLKSPIRDGVKYDASALLQRGQLAEFLKLTIGAHCANPDCK
jgi:ribosomal protein L37AE/L43A